VIPIRPGNGHHRTHGSDGKHLRGAGGRLGKMILSIGATWSRIARERLVQRRVRRGDGET